MNKFILSVVILITAGVSPLSASMCEQEISAWEGWSYGRVGTGFPDLLNLGVGYRSFLGRHGFDLSLNGGTCVLINEISLRGLYLNRFSPSCPSSYYAGVGVGVNYMNVANMMGKGWAHGVFPSIEATLGRDWRLESGRHLFLQLGCSLVGVERGLFPFTRLEFGFEF